MSVASTSNQSWGVLAEYHTAAEIYHACEKVREAGYDHWDAHTPFPVHGLDKAMGLSASKLPWISLVTGLTGTATALLLQWWVSTWEYPLVISGKPMFSLPAFVPIMFELSILFAAFGTLFGMLAINKLPRWEHPLFHVPRFDRVTDDRFFISIEASDSRYDAEQTMQLLRDSGAAHVEVVEAV